VITHQGGSSPVQLAMANVMVMHFGQAIAAKSHLKNSETEERKRKERAEKAVKEANGIKEDVHNVTRPDGLNRMA
jgi:hypothetical protein